MCFLRKLCLLQDPKGCLSRICLINLDLELLIFVWLTLGSLLLFVTIRGGLEGITAVNWFATVTVLLARVDFLRKKQCFEVVLMGLFGKLLVNFLCCGLILRIRLEKNYFALYSLEGNTVECETVTYVFCANRKAPSWNF